MNLKMCVLPFVITALLTSCSPAQSEYSNKNTLSEYDVNPNLSIKLIDCFNQKEDHYLVFFYSKTCPHCHEIMGDVLAFSDENIIKLYFLDTKESGDEVSISSDVDHTIGMSSTDHICIRGTPTILEIEEWYIKANVAGKEDCLSLLNELRLNYM